MSCLPPVGPGPGAIADTWSASDLALALANAFPENVLKIGSIYLLPKQNGFTGPVMSYQTRTRNWLQRIDEAPSGILLDTFTDTQTLEDGTRLVVTTERRQFKDSVQTTVTTQNLGTPAKTSIKVLEVNRSGSSTLRTIDTSATNGVRNTLESVTLRTQPPTNSNVQPITVQTVDGVVNYQWLGPENLEWAGGDREGTTTTARQEQIQPGMLNGQIVDSFGNPILKRVIDETVMLPTGEVEVTHTETTGIQNNVGSTTTDENTTFNGIQSVTTRTTNYPDGSQSISVKTSNELGGGDSVETTDQTITDIFGQVTTTHTVKETKTIADTNNVLHTTVTTTETVTKLGVSTTKTNTQTRNNFEDSIAADKVKVYMILEFTLNVIVDDLGLVYLQNLAFLHAQAWAKIELYGQMLSNLDLSYDLRQSLFQQYLDAVDQVSPVPFQALGQNFQVVFAPSAAAFRPAWVVGTTPHAFEVQMILQQRSDLINGTVGSFLG